MNNIKVNQLDKSFGKLQVLNNISFVVETNAVVALLGPSGSGKSTLLRCLNQLEIPDVGHIEIGDISLDFPSKHNRAYRHKVKQLRTTTGMVFQQFNLWVHRTILENMLEAPLKVLKKKRSEVEPKALALLEKVGILDKQNAYPGQLSGGQQQRVAIARALMMDPLVMLFDEPTSALDPEMSREVVSIVQQLASEGMTMVIATHEVGLARAVATNVVFIENGTLVEQGSAEQCLTAPKTARLTEFLAVTH